ncbi:MAG TPA: acetyl-CoA carboxylase biotin carboxyl carrier protein subunit [Bacteroidales bacterium]|jgi:biotin carboxyl carrier protein|nr:acetyl-CoA carboxylase biotin carboxyl carrier protein subunit [Bacteroidales bacterium]MDD4087035.1 acetyl-CoA carboxylase biotin carboxyl carrier protein subunit [Bacteroidales bacterium]MDY0084900.1 acetyl-CoA carboxylase biotin carboxyl carrier protein subunit [Bacteroidales bacterium]HPE42980.1 acetyl-CoA carboxylase biotin carboxyl carrier protein subunit [Bacteroidales bacterium]
MSYEIKINDRIAQAELLSRNGNQIQVMLDDKLYELDIVEVERGVYSIIHDNSSFNVELVEAKNAKSYTVNTLYESFDVQIIDAESKYLMNRKKDDGEDDLVIASPMPGKVVKVLVKAGDRVKAGETVVVVSAMKMESEYKVKQDRLIKKVLVKEGDTVAGDQPMVIIE